MSYIFSPPEESDFPDAPPVKSKPIVLSEGEELLRYGLRAGAFRPGVSFRHNPENGWTLFYNPKEVPSPIAEMALEAWKQHHSPNARVVIAPLNEQIQHTANDPLDATAKARREKRNRISVRLHAGDIAEAALKNLERGEITF